MMRAARPVILYKCKVESINMPFLFPNCGTDTSILFCGRNGLKAKIAKAMAVAGLTLILVYGAVAMFSIYFQKPFLPLGTNARETVIGIPAAVLSITAFFLSRKAKSRLIGLLLFITGILMMSIPFATSQFIAQDVSDLESFTKNIASFIPVVGFGMYIIVLGLGKLRD